ncbi:nucleotidyltransferase domain-containing protein [Candidatus Bathyarchaeota archaeon]|nr:nucleotidyltransferase domain-containing protein [Candidatus Bathyarchaeota archaeon]
MAKKPIIYSERLEVVYSADRWRLLSELRSRAIEIMEALERTHLFSITHGSIARGDVSPRSDIDVFIPQIFSSFTVENALRMAGISISRRILVQATPTYSIKGYIEIDERRCISFPLSRMREVERDFYKFGGEATLEMLRSKVRVPGVDKRLMLIEPTEKGHVESSIIGQEERVAKLLGISVDTVLDRVRTLLRRDKVGRTGLFVERELAPEESFESVLKRLADANPAVRRRLRED